MVCRRQVFLSGGITHSSFGGIGIAYYLGVNPVLGAMVFAVLSAIGVEYFSERGKLREDSVIGIIWSVGMAIGVIFIYMTPGYAPNLMSFLFGNILTVTSSDIASLAVLVVLLVAAMVFFARKIFYAVFDRDFAAGSGVAVRGISLMMSIAVALTIVLSIRAVGIVLLISLLAMPAVIANAFTKSYRRILLLSPAIAVTGNVAGLAVSYSLNVPAGASAIFVLTLVLIAVKLLPLQRKKLR